MVCYRTLWRGGKRIPGSRPAMGRTAEPMEKYTQLGRG